jgi:hypothetical protein
MAIFECHSSPLKVSFCDNNDDMIKSKKSKKQDFKKNDRSGSGVKSEQSLKK